MELVSFVRSVGKIRSVNIVLTEKRKKTNTMHTVRAVPFVDRRRFVSAAAITLSHVQLRRKVKTSLNQVSVMPCAHTSYKRSNDGKTWRRTFSLWEFNCI